jgi:hypothetical protein
LTTPLDQRTIGSDYHSGSMIMVIPARVGWRGLFYEVGAASSALAAKRAKGRPSRFSAWLCAAVLPHPAPPAY